MEKKKAEKDTISIELRQGGMIETMETGIYPQYLIFHSKKHGLTWQHKFTGDETSGQLKDGDGLIYSFRFENGSCTVMDPEGNIVGKGPTMRTMMD